METQTQEQGTNAAAPAALTGKRANWTIAHKVEGETITFQVKGVEWVLKLDLPLVSEANRKRAAIHGLVQRISDAAAMSRDPKTGASATPQEKYAAMKKLVEHYSSGSEEWSPARSTEGVGRPRANPNAELLMAALLIHAPQKGAEVIEKFVKGLGAAQVTALLNSAELKEAVELAREELRAREAKMAEGIQVEELLKGL